MFTRRQLLRLGLIGGALPLVSRSGPFPLGNSHIDRVLSMTMVIASEVAVLYDRLDTLERVASEKTRFSLDDLRQFQVDDEIEEAREQWRKSFIRRMLRILLEECRRKPTSGGPWTAQSLP